MPKILGSPTIRAELARAGASQADVAEWLGVHPSQVTARMQGRIEWRLSELQAIARHLDVPVAQLVEEPADAAAAAQ